VFPSVIVVMGALAVLYGLTRHRRYMEGIRQRRARELTAKRTRSTFAWASEITLTNVVSVDDALLIRYERVDPVGASPVEGTVVAYCRDDAALKVLEGWSDARVALEAQMDLSGRRLVLREITNSERVELSTVPVGSTS
jgi:hypothetical protein